MLSKTMWPGRVAIGVFILGGLLLSATTMVVAQPQPQYSAWGQLQELEGGWVEDSLSIRHSAPLVNPAGCTVTNAGYATNPADPGHALFHTLLLSAFLNKKEVSLLINGCAYNKPRVIAVKIH